MKSPKQFIYIGIGMLVLALGIGVYVWYTLIAYQNDLRAVEKGAELESSILMPEAQQPDTADVSLKESAVMESVEVDPGDSVGTSATAITEPVVIQKSDLSDTQQKLFDVLGFEGDTVTITPEMITCAESAVGVDRFTEIINGSAPGPLEAVKLISCTKN